MNRSEPTSLFTTDDKSGLALLNDSAAQYAGQMASIFQFLANVMNRLPDASLIEDLRLMAKNGFPEDLPKMGLGPSVRQGFYEISLFLDNLPQQSDQEVETTLAVDWTCLFRGVRPGYGPPPPYEGIYINRDRIGVETIQAVNSWYQKYQVGLSDQIQNRPDYLGFEFDFLRFLFEHEAVAWQKGDYKHAVNYHQDAMLFATEHIAGWVPLFVAAALPHAETGFYKGFLRIVEAVAGDLTRVETTPQDSIEREQR
jgi:TorA maturation chaperone TorD